MYSYVHNPNALIDPLGLDQCTSKLSDDSLVVRGGESTPQNLVANQAKDNIVNNNRGYISANAGNGLSLDDLAVSPKPFPNGQVSVTTVGDIRSIGMDVIPDPTVVNPKHASIIPRTNPISTKEAETLSGLFI